LNEPLAMVCVVGLVLGTATVATLGLVAMVRNKTLRLKAGRDGVDLEVEVRPESDRPCPRRA
jgi:hypothetical protein